MTPWKRQYGCACRPLQGKQALTIAKRIRPDIIFALDAIMPEHLDGF